MDDIERYIGDTLYRHGGALCESCLYKHINAHFDAKDGHTTMLNLAKNGYIHTDNNAVIMTVAFKELIEESLK